MSQESNDNDNSLLRIKASKIAELMDRVSELSLASDEVVHHKALRNITSENFSNSAMKLNQLVREFQDVVSNLRLVTIEGIFRRMQRLSRDLSKQTGKKFNFKMKGESTEIDKVVVDTLSEPLVHIIRNSVDHGLETNEERVKQGKEEIGEIELSARQEGGDIVICIRDNGAGLNKEKILERALEKKLITKNQQLEDHEIWHLIFLPGFSTKEQVTQLSGRGVGMDVVKTTIEYLRGRVDIESKQNIGTEFKLIIPLSVAFLDALIVCVNNKKYAVAIDSIFEVYQADNIAYVKSSIHSNASIQIREEIIPIKYLGVPTNQTNTENKNIFVVIQSNNKYIALPVDEIIGQYQVTIKPLSGVLSKLNAFCGCAILPDGDISWVIDIAQNFEEMNNVNILENKQAIA